jgi:hypothetical protein
MNTAQTAYKQGYYAYPAWEKNPHISGTVEAWMWDIGHHEAWCGLSVSL